MRQKGEGNRGRSTDRLLTTFRWRTGSVVKKSGRARTPEDREPKGVVQVYRDQWDAVGKRKMYTRKIEERSLRGTGDQGRAKAAHKTRKKRSAFP